MEVEWCIHCKIEDSNHHQRKSGRSQCNPTYQCKIDSTVQQDNCGHYNTNSQWSLTENLTLTRKSQKTFGSWEMWEVNQKKNSSQQSKNQEHPVRELRSGWPQQGLDNRGSGITNHLGAGTDVTSPGMHHAAPTGYNMDWDHDRTIFAEWHLPP